jgi:hypothetical protein
MVENVGAQRITDWVVFPFVTNVSFEFAGLQEGEVRFKPQGAVPYPASSRWLCSILRVGSMNR